MSITLRLRRLTVAVSGKLPDVNTLLKHYNKDKMNLQQIADRYGITPTAVYDKLKQHPDYSRRIKVPSIDVLIEHYKKGMTIKQIASKYGITSTSVYDKLKQHPDYVANKRSGKLPELTVLLNHLSKEGMTIKQIADKYKVTTNAVMQKLHDKKSIEYY